jgi:hypothetical protein
MLSTSVLTAGLHVARVLSKQTSNKGRSSRKLLFVTSIVRFVNDEI